MKLVSIPAMEIDGMPTQRQLFNPEEHAKLQVYSHKSQCRHSALLKP